MTENEIETPPVRPTSWRDNKAVLWLVRIGFLLQFYIPAIVCCWVAWVSAPFNASLHDDFAPGFFRYAILTLILLAVQYHILTKFLRSRELRSAGLVLGCLVVFNTLHGVAWLYYTWSWWLPITLIRLTPPNLLYLIAIVIEWIVFFGKKKVHPIASQGDAANNSPIVGKPTR